MGSPEDAIAGPGFGFTKVCVQQGKARRHGLEKKSVSSNEN